MGDGQQNPDEYFPRRRVMRRATIHLPQNREIACIVVSISRTGAEIVIEEQIMLPKHFVLDLSGNIAVKRVCELLSQEGLNVGVKFPKLNRFQSIQFDID